MIEKSIFKDGANKNLTHPLFLNSFFEFLLSFVFIYFFISKRIVEFRLENINNMFCVFRTSFGAPDDHWSSLYFSIYFHSIISISKCPLQYYYIYITFMLQFVLLYRFQKGELRSCGRLKSPLQHLQHFFY